MILIAADKSDALYKSHPDPGQKSGAWRRSAVTVTEGLNGYICTVLLRLYSSILDPQHLQLERKLSY